MDILNNKKPLLAVLLTALLIIPLVATPILTFSSPPPPPWGDFNLTIYPGMPALGFYDIASYMIASNKTIVRNLTLELIAGGLTTAYLNATLYSGTHILLGGTIDISSLPPTNGTLNMNTTFYGISMHTRIYIPENLTTIARLNISSQEIPAPLNITGYVNVTTALLNHTLKDRLSYWSLNLLVRSNNFMDNIDPYIPLSWTGDLVAYVNGSVYTITHVDPVSRNQTTTIYPNIYIDFESGNLTVDAILASTTALMINSMTPQIFSASITLDPTVVHVIAGPENTQETPSQPRVMLYTLSYTPIWITGYLQSTVELGSTFNGTLWVPGGGYLEYMNVTASSTGNITQFIFGGLDIDYLLLKARNETIIPTPRPPYTNWMNVNATVNITTFDYAGLLQLEKKLLANSVSVLGPSNTRRGNVEITWPLMLGIYDPMTKTFTSISNSYFFVSGVNLTSIDDLVVTDNLGWLVIGVVDGFGSFANGTAIYNLTPTWIGFMPHIARSSALTLMTSNPVNISGYGAGVIFRGIPVGYSTLDYGKTIFIDPPFSPKAIVVLPQMTMADFNPYIELHSEPDTAAFVLSIYPILGSIGLGLQIDNIHSPVNMSIPITIPVPDPTLLRIYEFNTTSLLNIFNYPTHIRLDTIDGVNYANLTALPHSWFVLVVERIPLIGGEASIAIQEVDTTQIIGIAALALIAGLGILLIRDRFKHEK